MWTEYYYKLLLANSERLLLIHQVENTANLKINIISQQNIYYVEESLISISKTFTKILHFVVKHAGTKEKN